jgi:beta-galactosidase
LHGGPRPEAPDRRTHGHHAGAIVYDYEAHWITAIQPQGEDFRYSELVFRWYETIRRLGLDVDFVPPGATLENYPVVLVPTLPHVTVSAERAFAAATGMVAFGPRSGSKTRHFSIPEELPPARCRASWILA